MHELQVRNYSSQYIEYSRVYTFHHMGTEKLWMWGVLLELVRMKFLLCLLLWPVVDSQTVPYISFMEETLPNHAYVDLHLVGDPDNGGTGVQCHTDLQMCCTDVQGGFHRGDWYFPNKTRLLFHEVRHRCWGTVVYKPDIYQSREDRSCHFP